MMTDTYTLIEALRILARDIESGDGVANAAIAEAADRLQAYHAALDVIAHASEVEDCPAIAREAICKS